MRRLTDTIGRLSALAAHYAAADGTRIASAFFADLGGRGVLDVLLQVLLFNTRWFLCVNFTAFAA